MGDNPDKKVFISSTTKDLWQYRQVAVGVIEEINKKYGGKYQLKEVTMDTEPKDTERKTPVDRSRTWVKECDWLVSIIAWNYGHVPEDQKRSVTEWEFREAEKNGIPCFIFIAGESGQEKGDGKKAYRPLPEKEEEVNLLDWKSNGEVKLEDVRALAEFKAELRNKDIHIFSNIKDFSKQLKETLENSIDLELQRPLFLFELMKLKDQIRNCLEQVNLLVSLKQIHDRLHHIRQLGIRRWREEVSTQLNEDHISDHTKCTYLLGLNMINESRWKLDGYVNNLPDQPELNHLKIVIGKVLETEFKEQPENKESFDYITSLYAKRVQESFMNANRAMLNKANNLKSCQIFEAFRTNTKLKPNNEQFLRNIVNVQNDGHVHLQLLFNNHNDWQSLHDQLERIDETKGSTQFKYDLIGFLDNPEKVEDLLKHATKIADQSDNKTDWQKKIAGFADTFTALRMDKSEDIYERMRKNFDDLFFEVDKDTLNKVERSKLCAMHSLEAIEAEAQLCQLNKPVFNTYIA